MDFCKVYSLVAFTHVDRNTALFTRLRCKQWSCEYCAEKNRQIWAAFLIDRLPEISDTWYLVTLTAHSRLRTPEASLKNIRDNLDRLFKRVRRVFGKIEYVRVYEKHPTSEARHAHLIVSGLTDFVVRGASAKHVEMFVAVTSGRRGFGVWSVKTWFKYASQAVTMGYIVDVQKIAGEPRKAVGYVVKYLTKAQQELGEKGLRHVQTSRLVGSPKVEGEYQWKVVSFVTARDFHAGQVVTDLQIDTPIPSDYFEQFDLYPPEMN